MPSIRLHQLIARHDLVLLVFYEPRGYQFRLVNELGEVFGQTKIFYTAEAAERAGREWLAGAA